MMKIQGCFKTIDGKKFQAISIDKTNVIGLELNPVHCDVRANATPKTFNLENIRFVELRKNGKSRYLQPGKSCFSIKTTLEFYGL